MGMLDKLSANMLFCLIGVVPDLPVQSQTTRRRPKKAARVASSC
jgi:hypothetical protein